MSRLREIVTTTDPSEGRRIVASLGAIYGAVIIIAALRSLWANQGVDVSGKILTGKAAWGLIASMAVMALGLAIYAGSGLIVSLATACLAMVPFAFLMKSARQRK